MHAVSVAWKRIGQRNCEVITRNLFCAFAPFARGLSVFIAPLPPLPPGITREATLSTDACTCPINFQRDGTHRFCVNIYYSVSRGRRLQLHPHASHTRDLLVTMAAMGYHGISKRARLPDPSFFQIKKRWTLATSDVWWQVGSREALWRCNARAADFFFLSLFLFFFLFFFWDLIYSNEMSGLRKIREWKVQSCKSRRSLVATWSDVTGWCLSRCSIILKKKLDIFFNKLRRSKASIYFYVTHIIMINVGTITYILNKLYIIF